MQAVRAIGLDIAKSVFQVHGIDATGQFVIRRQLRRHYVLAFFEKLQPCLVGTEACATSHYWARAECGGAFWDKWESVLSRWFRSVMWQAAAGPSQAWPSTTGNLSSRLPSRKRRRAVF